MIWAAIGSAMLRWTSNAGLDNYNLQLLGVFSGAPFGAAVGSLFDRRFVGAMIGVPAWKAVVLAFVMIRPLIF